MTLNSYTYVPKTGEWVAGHEEDQAEDGLTSATLYNQTGSH